MKVTSAEANKMLKKLNDDKRKLMDQENARCTYNAAVNEDPSSLKPDYNFSLVQNEIKAIDDSILHIKHCINVFNTTTEVMDGITIDQALVKLPQLQMQSYKLSSMMKRQPRERKAITGNIIDYTYTSYNPDEAKVAYDKVIIAIDSLQLALDTVNNTVTFEI